MNPCITSGTLLIIFLPTSTIQNEHPLDNSALHDLDRILYEIGHVINDVIEVVLTCSALSETRIDDRATQLVKTHPALHLHVGEKFCFTISCITTL